MSKSKYKKILVSAAIISAVFLGGCGLLGGEKKKEIDPPKEVTMTNGEQEPAAKNAEPKSTNSEKDAVAEETIKTELYLIDKNGLVVPQTLNLPKTESVAKQALEYLVDNGKVTDMLPNGFKAVLPADTKLTVNVKDKVATVDFSNEFKNYQPEDELKILQSVTWTLTQFDSIEKVKLQMNGHPLEEMPVNGTPIGDELTRKDGINLDISNSGDITNTRPVTVYFLSGEKGGYYFVPVTKRVSNMINNNITAAVQELVKGPSANSNLLNEFSPDAKLIDKPKFQNGNVTLNFNEEIYGSFDEKVISKNVLQSLVLSLTEQSGIESVSITVNGKTELVNEEGKKLTEPVTRPEYVNTGSF
ncbi:GerMN domain-containing protein [Bacillus benzoevorans]|uniref:Germination protein M n=1 Tax=Bacillus benzoevorans TaxID=1456 RepID=A0A7X0HU70_9BACI|nr:GerMN domain-containing protein [Bacillus benzoevorans]MBB6445641.1 germination protein M [Bacillus benzoevorans]